MITCDLCGEAKVCLQKEIKGKEYDFCSQCWAPFALKLKGRGRIKNRVFLPPPTVVKEPEDEEPKPNPGEPPKIVGRWVAHIDRPSLWETSHKRP